MRKGSTSGAAHGERAPVSWAKITVADFGGTGVSDCAVGNTARDTSGSNPSLSTRKSEEIPQSGPPQFPDISRSGTPTIGIADKSGRSTCENETKSATAAQEAARAKFEELAGKAAAQELRFKNKATL